MKGADNEKKKMRKLNTNNEIKLKSCKSKVKLIMSTCNPKPGGKKSERGGKMHSV